MHSDPETNVYAHLDSSCCLLAASHVASDRLLSCSDFQPGLCMTSTSTCNLQRSTCHLPLSLHSLLSQCMCFEVRQCVSSSGADLTDTLGFVRVTRVPTSLYRVQFLGQRSRSAAASLGKRRVPSSSQLARTCARSDHRACRLSTLYKRSQPLVCTLTWHC